MSEQDDYLDAYLAEHHDRYTREALTNELVEKGNDPAAIEAAWERLDRGAEPAGPAPTPSPGGSETPGWPPAAPAGSSGGSKAGAVLAGIVIMLVYCGSMLAAFAAIAAGGAVSILMIAYIVTMIAGLIYSLQRLSRAASAMEGASSALAAFAISALIFIGLSGACFVLLGPAINATSNVL